MNTNEKTGIKQELKKEFLRNVTPSGVIYGICIGLICLDIAVVDNLIYTVVILTIVFISLICVSKQFFLNFRDYYMISRDKFDIVKDKLYRIGVGENKVLYGKRTPPNKETDSNPSKDVFHFCRYGSFVPLVKHQTVAFPGDEFYLVVLKNKNKTIVRAYRCLSGKDVTV